MLKKLLLLFLLFSSSAIFANTLGEKTKAAKQTNQLAQLSQVVFDHNYIGGNLTEHTLPEAILRLYQLEKIKFTGEMIYTHKPLELAKIKSPVKTV